MVCRILLSLLAIAQFSIAEPITLMTFNVRYGTADDGENSWEFRKDHVVETIENTAPAVLAIQEALVGQLKYIDEHFPGYKKIGEHRNGNTTGEFSGLLIDTSTLEILEEGQMWLSETPEKISKGWDAALQRTATWATVRRVGTSSPSFVLFSTHFDHHGKTARLESAKLIVEKARELSGEKQLPIAIMGDFNCTPGSEPFKVFKEFGFSPAVTPTYGGGTYNKFSGSHYGLRIDFIFLNNNWKICSAEILRPRKDGKCASDHDPIVAFVMPVVPPRTDGSHDSTPSSPN